MPESPTAEPTHIVLSRKLEESIVFYVPASDKPTRIECRVERIYKEWQGMSVEGVRLGSIAPRAVKILRGELETPADLVPEVGNGR